MWYDSNKVANMHELCTCSVTVVVLSIEWLLLTSSRLSFGGMLIHEASQDADHKPLVSFHLQH